ncbi:katanin p80 WD40 repeat-containing subunit B1 [Caerostris extrusa]|uniref:Katanin p80 WD40 repeat-containing subunit B1 n=1 Tax=Caerostris extrusa TaxID=172846 RepID=A0AAV4UN18_CAEEX|nr:katanin p80 WD40 repeat-containing subunit B1 [Caerostris extrusa]
MRTFRNHGFSSVVKTRSSWTLDMCQLLLPVICDLLKSKYETYITIGCMTLKLIMKNFSQVIKIQHYCP